MLIVHCREAEEEGEVAHHLGTEVEAEEDLQWGEVVACRMDKKRRLQKMTIRGML
jgi:Ser-tRNA(Ala) deacylase AlaX